MVAEKVFRFSASKVLLTFSQVCENFHAECILYDFEERFHIDTYVIGEERHEDGGRHYHATFTFKKKIDSRDVTIFDINCGDHQHHPNIKSIQRGQAHLDRAREYCKKEDPAPLSNVPEKLTWGEMIAQSANAEEFLSQVRKHYPEKYCQNLKNYEYSASKIFPSANPNTIESYRWDPENGDDPPAWVQIDERVLDWNPQSHALVIVGPAGCGKSTWSKLHALKPCLWIRHLDNLQLLRPHHRSVIFDDMDFRHLPVPTQKYLVDCRDTASVHIRYRVATLPSGLMRIFTANNYPFQVLGNDIAALERRIKEINLY